MIEEDHILCELHEQPCTVRICQHLAEDPGQRWYCDYPTEDNPWPDAWCAQCDAEFRKEGEWNERNLANIEVCVICPHCYENGLSASVEARAAGEPQAWKMLVRHSYEELKVKQDRLAADFGVGVHKQWDYDPETAMLVFSNDGVPAVIADVEFIGTLSRVTHVWKWSWANFELAPAVRGRIGAVRAFGEEQGFFRLTVPTWQADEVEAWEIAGIAVRVLDAYGAYRVQSDHGFIYMAIMGIRRVGERR